jgi:quercetin dioxygenase-like cupin family protein
MPTHISWESVDPPTEDEVREIMTGEGLSPERWMVGDGYRFPVHEHDYHKVVYCVDGSIWFTFPDDPDNVIELEPGDRLDLPAGVRHGALAGMEGVVCLEARKG